MSQLPESKDESDEGSHSGLMKMSNSNANKLNNRQLQLQMQEAVIGDLQFGILDETKNETNQIRKFKKSKQALNKTVNDLKHNIEEYSQLATTEQSQRSAYNLKGAIITTVNGVNGLMANSVMNAEIIPNDMSQSYRTASALLQQSLSGVVETAVNQAMYNQRNLLNDLKEETSIQHDKESMKCIKNIEDIDNAMRRHGRGMKASYVAEQCNNAHRNYQKLSKRAKVLKVPKQQQNRIKRREQLWKIAAGIAVIVVVVSICAGIAIYYAGMTATVSTVGAVGTAAQNLPK
eukprot:430731_1